MQKRQCLTRFVFLIFFRLQLYTVAMPVKLESQFHRRTCRASIRAFHVHLALAGDPSHLEPAASLPWHMQLRFGDGIMGPPFQVEASGGGSSWQAGAVAV